MNDDLDGGSSLAERHTGVAAESFFLDLQA